MFILSFQKMSTILLFLQKIKIHMIYIQRTVTFLILVLLKNVIGIISRDL